MRSPIAAIGASALANTKYGICERLPMMMFCGFPVIVATLPMLDAVAMAVR